MTANDKEAYRMPFHDRGGLFPATAHEEAIARILFLIEQQWPAGWLMGPAGCGKTTVLEAIRQRLRGGRGEAVYLSLCGVDADEFWTEIASALGSRQIESGLAARRTIRGLLAASSMINRPVTILLDDVDRGIEPLWDAIAGLVRVVEGLGSGHTIVLASSGAMPTSDLAGRIDLRAEVGPFSKAETRAYLEHRLTSAGCPIGFDEEAASELHQSTGGVPGVINRFADLALVTAQAGEATSVTADLVRSAALELRPIEDEPLVRFTVNQPARRASA